MGVSEKTEAQHDELIAFLLGDGAPSPATRCWLVSDEGRRELAAYGQTLGALDAVYGGTSTRLTARASRHAKRGPSRAGREPARAGRRPAHAARGGAVSAPERRVYYAEMCTPLGPLALAVTDRGLARVAFGHGDAAFAAELRRRLEADVVESSAKLTSVVAEIERYFAGKGRNIDLRVDLAAVTPFQRRVLLAARRVPAGRVVSYGDIARRIGRPRASRAVGQALARNPVPIVIPCHRVVTSGGGLGGYTGGLGIKKKLLAIEGTYP
jgi:methylated-DNA-[protein]-cysteine S-methyltransferase